MGNRVGGGTLFRSPMAKFLSWTIYLYDFESYLFDRVLFYEKACFHSGVNIILKLKNMEEGLVTHQLILGQHLRVRKDVIE